MNVLIEIMKHMVNNLGYIVLMAFVLSKLKMFKNIFIREEFSNKEKFILTLIFGTFGILGTYIGTDVNGAIANTRIIGIMVGGILCGPIVGLFAGVIAGLHRILIDFGGITALPCAITTIFSGLAAGIIHKKVYQKKYWIYGLLGGTIMESLGMVLILIMSKPFEQAFTIVRSIYVPMVLINGIGIALVILMIESIFHEKEKLASDQAKLALEIANKTLPFFRHSDNNSFEKVCQIIKESTNSDAVAITDREKILSHIGAGSDHHIPGATISTSATEFVLKSGDIKILNNKDDICCLNSQCGLKSGIIVPLKDNDKVVGTLKIYYTKDHAINHINKVLAIGLSQIISTQIEISKIERLETMNVKSELKALQAQINPHFLFNALNTIISFIRIDPSKARELIINLSTYLRYNIDNIESMVDINKEIEQIKAYIDIEKARFSNRINVQYDIDELNDFKIPSLIIQPLVENSIKHGILKNNLNGNIIIKIKDLKNKLIQISIEDNGSGIPNSVINSLKSSNFPHHNIGLLNVHKRLEMHYGEGLKIENLSSGSRITFNIPREQIL
ncbi:sensor histidine kinase [Acetoanaerobium pronyense]|uniref:sensor histidine kinase n=1 Tax=Acetoanaerobium pronyense TaxID=1482736 RepID=UPI001FD96DF3|nr:sensor histidine kinase [Acetoanaerobium pronyense]